MLNSIFLVQFNPIEGQVPQFLRQFIILCLITYFVQSFAITRSKIKMSMHISMKNIDSNLLVIESGLTIETFFECTVQSGLCAQFDGYCWYGKFCLRFWGISN